MNNAAPDSRAMGQKRLAGSLTPHFIPPLIIPYQPNVNSLFILLFLLLLLFLPPLPFGHPFVDFKFSCPAAWAGDKRRLLLDNAGQARRRLSAVEVVGRRQHRAR